MRTTVIACVKCEEKYIREWIEWNLSIGIDHFYLADNNDLDYQPTLTSVIKDYIDDDIVTIVDCRGIEPAQPTCYNTIINKYGDEYDWYVAIDVDEFLYLPKHQNIKTFLGEFDDTDAIYIHWLIYGDNEHIKYEEGNVQQRFTKVAKVGKSKYVKTIFRNKSTIESHTKKKMIINNIHRVVEGKNTIVKNCMGDRIIIPNNKGFMCLYKDDEFEIAHLKHYITKSLEEYVTTKRKRGAGLRTKTHQQKYTSEFYFIYNEKTKEKIRELYTC